MPLISQIGRKAPSVRLLIGFIYLALITGGVTMVYPLLLMVSGSVKGEFDAHDIEVIPRYLRDETTFFRRYLESKYGSLSQLNSGWGADFTEWTEIQPPRDVSKQQLDDFDEFRRALGYRPRWVFIGHVGVAGKNQRDFKLEILREADGDLVRAGQILGVNFHSWAEVVPKQFGNIRLAEITDPWWERTVAFAKRRPVEDLIFGDVEALWKTTLLPKYERNIQAYSRRTGIAVKSWDDLHLTQRAPDASRPAERSDWEEFVRQRVPFTFLKLDPSAAPAFHEFLGRAHANDLNLLNKSYGTTFASFDEVPLGSARLLQGTAYLDFSRFVRTAAPLESLSLDGPNFRYRSFLSDKFQSDVAAVRAAYGVNWSSFDEVSMPTSAVDWRDFQKQKSGLRWYFLTRNYGHVLDFLARHGRGFQNTGILVVLYLVTHLTVNPLAAYALSRFGLPSTFKILLFCMATVAFPGEVMMIPSFLQIKEFGLLNTFWALVLPGLASGYSIFLLKGFFDSLPRELYESATIDGASEWTIFWNITMSLSKPILAVMALGSFTGAFGTFFYALIICPDEKMWTLMVWLYQLQMISGSQSINYAALCLSSIPTLLVFVFCQRIIMRGIVVPTEK